MKPETFDELLACYALGALDDDERRMVEERLAADPAARDRLAAYEQAVMVAANELGPPDHLWDRLTRLAFPGVLRAPHPRRLAGRPSAAARPMRRAAALVAGAACLAALGTGIALATRGGDRGTRPSLTALAHAARNAHGARITTLRRPDGTVGATAVVLPNGSGYLTTHLAQLGTSRTYQLWAMGDSRTISLGVLGPHPQTVAFTLVGHPRQLLITDEAAPGAPVSDQPPRAAGPLPSS